MTNLLSPAFLGSSIATFSIGFWAYSFDRKNRTLRRWFLFCLSVAFWSFGLGMLTSSTSIKIANFFYGVHYVGAIHIPFCFLLFVKCYFHKNLKFDFDLSLCCAIALLQLWFFFTGQLVGPLTPKWHFTFYTNPAKFYWLFIAYFFLYTAYSFFLMFTSVSKTKLATERKSRVFFLLATALGYAGGSSAFLLVYDINLPPYGIFLFLAFPIITTYSIVRYKFLDIEVIIKRTLIFAGLLAMVMAVVAVMSTLVNGFISRWFAVSQSVVAVGSSLGVIALFDPVRKILVNWTDRFLFQKNEDFKVALNRLSRSIVSILEIDKIAKTILSTLDQTLRLETVAILIKDESGKEYRILDSFGLESFGKCIVSDHIIIQYLIGQSEIINLEDAETAKSLPLEITDTMAEFKAVLAIPLRVEGDLVGLLFWGKKKSDQEFTQDELSFLPAVAAQVAIAFSYARAIDILKKSQIDFAQQSKLAALGTLSAGISHEIKNPMNQIGMAVSMLKFKEKNNLYAGASPEEFKKEVFESLERVENDVKRVNDIVERLSAFAKKPKEVKLEDIHIAETVDGVLAIVEAEFRNHQIQIVKHYELDVPLIRADYHAIEEVMLNLFVNAQHAIKEKGMGQGVVRIDIKSRPQEVEVSVRDSGVGIPAENLEKIFDPFFTTKDVSRNPDPNAIKGTGLGLHLIREILKRYGGRILVESVVGEGTVFRVLFPC